VVRTSRARLATLLVLVAMAPAPVALAHKKKVARSIKLEPTRDALYVWVALEVPAGRGKDTLVALADTRHDGTLDAAEHKQLERTLAVRALDGVALWVDGATRALDAAELKLSAPMAGDAPLQLVILGHVPLGPAPARVGVTTVTVGDPIELGVLPGERPVLSASRGTVVRGALDTVLGTPDRVSWRIAGAPPAAR
jgi:hypothetical protein